MTPEDKLEFDRLAEEINELAKKRVVLRARCKHENVTSKECNNLNYKDPLEQEIYWEEISCVDCELTWNSDYRTTE